MKPFGRFGIFRKRIKQKLFSSSKKIIYTKDLLDNRYNIGEYTYGKPRVLSWGEGAITDDR